MYRTARQNAQTALGERDLSPMKSGWFLVPSSFCPWKGQPACSPGPLQGLGYARALEWEGTWRDFKQQMDCSVHFKGASFFLWIPDLISLHELRIVLSSALSYPCSGCSRGNLLCCKWKMNGITQVILVYLQQFSSSCFDSN